MTELSSAPNQKKILWMIAGFAVLIRLFCLIWFRSYTSSIDPGFASGYEVGFISRSLIEGRGFGSPFGGETGPTAWIAPLYPALQVLVFKCFGVDTLASAFVMRTINIATAPLMCILLYRIASRIWNARMGIAAAAAFAIFPDSIWFDSTMVWDTILATALLFILVDMVVARRDENPRADVKFGIVGGTLALVSPSLLSGVAVCLVWRSWQMLKGRARSMALTVLVMAAMVAPWMVRNYLVFGKPVFIRGNFGHELFKGNHLGGESGGQLRPPATGQDDWSLNPINNEGQFRKYQDLGELEYVADHKRQGIAAIKKYPFWFFKLVRRRIDAFWNGPIDLGGIFTADPEYLPAKRIWFSAVSLCGMVGILVSLLRREAFAPLFASIVVVYPLVYYITFPHSRYRYPLEPILLMCGLHLGSLAIAYLRRRLAVVRRGRVPASAATAELP